VWVELILLALTRESILGWWKYKPLQVVKHCEIDRRSKLISENTEDGMGSTSIIIGLIKEDKYREKRFYTRKYQVTYLVKFVSCFN
jgi:hypothetical protein